MAPFRISWKDPDTGRRFIAKTRVELIQKIVTYRAQNELEPIENLNLVLENYWCHLRENKHLCTDATLERGWKTYLKGGINLVKTMLFNSYVDQETADKRSEICASCPMNIVPSKTNWETWADDVAEHTIGDRKSKFHDKLNSCQVCTCVMKSKVWIGEKLEFTPDELSKFPNFCWQKIEASE